MRTPIRAAVFLVGLGIAGCSGPPSPPSPTPAPLPTQAPTLAPTPIVTSPVVTAVPATATAMPAATAALPILSGDAATNASCALATVEEISAQVDAGVREMRGLTSPGAFARTSLSCAWYLDSTAIGIPSVVVQWEFPVESFHDAVADLYRLNIKQKLAVEVPATGDMAMLQGSTAEAIAEQRIVRVSVLQHAEPTEEDKADTIALLRLFLERTKPE